MPEVDSKSILSPFVLPIGIVIASVCQQSTTCIPYLIMLIFFTAIRIAIFNNILESSPELQTLSTDSCKTNIPFFTQPVHTISIFISTYSFVYACLPMIILQYFNTTIFILMFCFCITNIGVFWTCYTPITRMTDVILGIVFAVASILILMASNKLFKTTDNFLFIGKASSNAETCSVAQNQNFVCSVYKNGELVNSFNKN